MRIIRNVRPARKGAKKLPDQFGSRLACVRYRYDEQKHKRFKTDDLVIEESFWSLPSRFSKDSNEIKLIYWTIK